MNQLEHEDIDTQLHRVTTEAAAIEGVFPRKSDCDRFARQTAKLRSFLAERRALQITRGDLVALLFKGQTPASVRTQLSRFRGYLEKVGCSGPGRFLLRIPDARSADGAAAACTFEGDSLAERRMLAEMREAVRASQPEAAFVPARAWPDTPRFFVSFAWADRALVNAFLSELRTTLNLLGVANFEFWKCDDYRQSDSGIPIGGDIERSISQAMQRCPFGLLLLSPAYFESDLIHRLERPYYFGANAKGHGLPIGVGKYRPGDKPVNCPEIADGLVYFLPKSEDDAHDLSYVDLQRSPKRREQFIRGLAERIKDLLAKYRPVESADRSKAVPALPEYIKPIQPGDESDAGFDPGSLRPEHFTAPDRGRYIAGRAARETTLAKAPANEPRPPETGVDLLSELQAWLEDINAAAYCALLGETGSGKTMACLEFSRRLLEQRETSSSLPVPIYLDLRLVNQDGLLETNSRPLLDDILAAIVRRSAHKMPSPAAILRAVRSQSALLIWDGLDEVLVHLSEQAGEAFFAELRKALPVEAVARAGASRLLFACRTQYFRGMAHEVSLFTESRKSGINPADDGNTPVNRRARYLILRVLPFEEDQIRAYLAANVPGVDLDRALEVICSIHNLRELAGRPFLLSLMRPLLARHDHHLAAGRTVRSVDLYAGFIEEWQERNSKMNRILRDDKPLLMERLAAHLWREGIKSIPTEALDRWLRREIVTDPLWIHHYGETLRSDAEALMEHFRDATFLGRWDGDAFRFAHTSLQEYFLACHLIRALEAGNADAWALPMPSRETFDFMVELRQKKADESPATSRRMDAALTAMLQSSVGIRPTSNQQGLEAPATNKYPAFAFWLRRHQPGQPELPVVGMDLSHLDLTAWLIAPGGGPWGGRTPDLPPPVRLGMAGLKLHRTCLIRAGFGGADLTRADLTDADARTVEFQHCRMEGITWPKPDKERGVPEPEGILVRGGRNAACLITENKTRPAPWHFQLPLKGCWNAAAASGPMGWVQSCSFSPDDSCVVFESLNCIQIRNAHSGKIDRIFGGHEEGVTECRYSPDGRFVVSCGYDHAVRIWDAATGASLRTLKGHSKCVRSCGYSCDGSMIVSCGDDERAIIWDAASGKMLHALIGLWGEVLCCSFSPAENIVATSGYDGTVRIWDASNGILLRSLGGHMRRVRKCGFSKDGRLILSVDEFSALRVWDAHSGTLILELEGYPNHIYACDISPDGRKIISAGKDYTARVWDVESGRLLRTLTGHNEPVFSCAFSIDGTRIVTGGGDRTVRIWDTASGVLLRSIEGYFAGVSMCAVTPEGNAFVAHLGDDTVMKWCAHTGEALSVTEEDRAIAEVGGYTDDPEQLLYQARLMEITHVQTLRQTDPATGAFVREICPFNDGEWAVLEPRDPVKDAHLPENVKVVIRRATPGAWRYLAYVARDERGDYVPDAPVLEAECFGPLPPP